MSISCDKILTADVGAFQIEKGPVFDFIKNEKGQSIVEYVLLLIVVIAIATAAGIRLFKPVSKWADFYMGTYTQCLLDSGELPKIAGGNPQECDELAQEAGYGDDPNNPNNPNGKNSNNAANEAAGNINTSSSSSRTANAGRSGRTSYRRGGKSFQSDSPNEGGGAGTDSSGKNSEDGPGGRVRFIGDRSGNAFRNSKDKVRIVNFSNLVDQEKKRIKRREERISKAAEVDSSMRPQKKLLIKPPVRKLAQDDDNIQNFTLSGFLRMLIIIAIILITVMVIISQLNSISKSMDK